MKFYEGPEELKDVIEKYAVAGKNMVIFYLNNRVKTIQNYTEEEENQIKEIMLRQLQERNETVKINQKRAKKVFDESLLTLLSTSYVINRIKFEDINTCLAIISIFGMFYLLVQTCKDKVRIDDIKKSTLFLDMYEELNTTLGKDIVTNLNFDKIYSEDLNVNTLDRFSYNEVKEVHKKLMKTK